MDDSQNIFEATKPGNWSAWQNEIEALGVTNPLVNFDESTFGQIDLERAHPGGLAQFVSSGSAVLSNLVRDPLAYSRAAAAARRIKQKADNLIDNFGIESLYLVGGLVSFEADGFDLDQPIFMWPLQLTVKGDDFEMSIVGKARVNPALIDSLDICYGVRLDSEQLLSRLDQHSDLLPIAALEYLAEISGEKARLDLKRILVISNFTTVGIELKHDFEKVKSPILQKLADHSAQYESGQQSSQPEKLTASEADTTNTFLVADADSVQQSIVNRAVAGDSFAVETLPGCGYTQTVANVLAALVHSQKRVLVLAPRRQTLNELSDRLATLGLAGLGVRSTHTWIDTVAAISRNEKAKAIDISETQGKLSEATTGLQNYFASLNLKHEELGVSIAEVLEELSLLSAMPHAPVTSARIASEKLAANLDRSEALKLLSEAFDLGEFKYGPQDTAWYQARFDSIAEVDSTLALAIRLRDESFAKLSQQLEAFIAAANFKPAKSVADWGLYLNLFSGVRETLDRFVPDVFDRPLGELIAATAARKEKGKMSGGTRRRLKKLAKEYLRPGMAVSDMNASLRAIEEQREKWLEFCTVPTPPRVHGGINDALVSFQVFMADLNAISIHLDPQSDEPDLSELNLEQLEAKLNSLAQGTEALANLGERALVTKRLDELGLNKLVRDLGRLHVAKEHLAIELDLAWWQSALEVLCSQDSMLLSISAEKIRELEDAFCHFDSKALDETARNLSAELNERWVAALKQVPAEAAAVKALLKTGDSTIAESIAAAPNVFRAVAPVLLMSPYEVPTTLGTSETFDTLIILDAAGSTTAENFSGLKRARQVIAFGDDAIAIPVGFETEARPTPLGREFAVTSVYQDVRDYFGCEVLRRSYRANGQPLGGLINREFYQNRIIFEPTANEFFGFNPLTLEILTQGNRANSTIEGANESLDAEVAKTVELIFNHALWHPGDSLLVSTASVMHADRIRAGVRAGLRTRAHLTSFFESHGREKFEVAPMSEVAHRTADRVIFSIGFGRSPSGAVPSKFGQLSDADGRRALANLLVSSRNSITVVSCFDGQALTDHKLTGGASYLKDLLEAKSARPADPQFIDGDPMLQDLAIRLQTLGAKVDARFGDQLGIVASYGKKATVIEPDWSWLNASLRERLRLRPTLLTALGWQYLRVHSFEMFADPQALANQICENLGLQVFKRAQPLFENSELAFEDTDAAWGDAPGSNDRRLREDKPPHWG